MLQIGPMRKTTCTYELRADASGNIFSQRYSSSSYLICLSSVGENPDAIPISKRVRDVTDRAIPGHWEGELTIGSKDSYIITLVERTSRFIMLAKISNNITITVTLALSNQPGNYLLSFIKITMGRSSEMTSHNRLIVSTNIQFYFFAPQSSWQCRSNEKYEKIATTISSIG